MYLLPITFHISTCNDTLAIAIKHKYRFHTTTMLLHILQKFLKKLKTSVSIITTYFRTTPKSKAL